jgi:hypothetical protein
MKRILISLLLIAAWPAEAGDLTPSDRRQILETSAKLIEQRYVDPQRGRKIAQALRSSYSRWADLRDPHQFAEALTAWLRSTSGDGHLGLSYSEAELSENGGEDSFSAAELDKWYGPGLNHGIEKIERLPGNVMLLDLRVFPPADMAGDVLTAAMNLVAQGDALIIDLRNNGGGADTSAALLTGYLLDRAQPLSGTYDRPSDRMTPSQSPHWVPGRRFGETKPLYILTSRKTFSAAEAFAYDLQALKRATVIGEVTGGGAHPFAYRRVHPHFALDLPEGRSVNPVTGTNWQDVGVRPDVPVAADQALDKALALARSATIKGRSAAASDPRSLP